MATKTKSTQLAIATDEDPRARMKLVRREVARAIKDGKRVDLLNYNKPDCNRALIALQDLLEKEKTKHAKAREYIINAKSIIGSFSQLCRFISGNAEAMRSYDQATIGLLIDERDKFKEQVRTLQGENQSMAEDFYQSRQENNELQDKLDAALTTLQTVMGNN